MAQTSRKVRHGGPGGPRRRWRGLVAAHPLVSATAAVALLAGLVMVLTLYQLQKLFIETTVDEALPSAATTAPSPTSAPTAAAPARPPPSQPARGSWPRAGCAVWPIGAAGRFGCWSWPTPRGCCGWRA